MVNITEKKIPEWYTAEADVNTPDYLKYTRAKPIVATTENPVTTIWGQTSSYDESNPQDFIFQYQAKQLSGKPISYEDNYNYLKAQQKQTELNAATAENPYSNNEYLSNLQATQQRALKSETASDKAQLEAFKKSAEADYQEKYNQYTEQWDASKQAAQKVYSFSWFGRSTSAAKQLASIQEQTNSAQSALLNAKNLAIAAEEARLAWADSDELTSINQQIADYNNAAQERQLKSIEETAAANAEASANFNEAFSNLLKTASDSGVQLWDAWDIQEMAQLARNADWSINEEFVSSLPDTYQALIRNAAATSVASETEDPDIQKIGKNSYWYFKDWELVTIGWWSGSWGATVSSDWAWPNGTFTEAQTMERNDLLHRIQVVAAVLNDPVKRSAMLASWWWDTAAQLNYLRNNLTLDHFIDTKKQGATYGAMSEWERDILSRSASSLPAPGKVMSAFRSPESILEDLNRILAHWWYSERVSVGWNVTADAAGSETNTATIDVPTNESTDEEILKFLNS